MDKRKAKELEAHLVGKNIAGYTIDSLINNGKSAAVFLGYDNNGEKYAVKIFDNDLIERFGHEIQERRIQQEISLKGHSIPNLVKIIDGNKYSINNDEYYYIIMEYINGKNLKEFIESEIYDHSFIKKVIKALVDVTDNLISRNIVHRDIKPENVMVSSNGEIILMDLGVLKLIGIDSFSDVEEKQFVGTLRYAPPEFLTRSEEDTVDGWRAINLYQIGGILHDLIMKKELFEDKNPYPNLVIAIKDDYPIISNSTFPYKIISLARNLLTKDWRTRLNKYDTNSFSLFYTDDNEADNDIDKELEELFNYSNENKAKHENIEALRKSAKELDSIRESVANNLEKVIDNAIVVIQNKGVFKRFTKSKRFLFDADKTQSTPKMRISNFLYQLQGDLVQGFPKDIYLVVRLINNEHSECKIEIAALSLGPFIRSKIDTPRNIFAELTNTHRNRYGQPMSIETEELVNDTVIFDDQFSTIVTLAIVRFLKTVLKFFEADVRYELAEQEARAKGEPLTISPTGNLNKNLFFPIK